MKLKRYSKKNYRFLVIADIISVLFLFLYLCYLKKYMNDYMYYILSIYSYHSYCSFPYIFHL